MIKRFSVLYVGQIDLESVGADGTAPDDRRYTNEQLIQTYSNAMSLAKQMDESGFYCLWAAEHHFQREGYECIPVENGVPQSTDSKTRSHPSVWPRPWHCCKSGLAVRWYNGGHRVGCH